MEHVRRNEKAVWIFGVALAIVCAVSGCVSRQARPDDVIRLGATRGERYAAALEQATEEHGRAVATAASRWYPSYSEAYGAAVAHIEPDLRALIARCLARQGLTLEGLNRFAGEHPQWLANQNRLHEERMAPIRALAFSIMGRIDAERARPTIDYPQTDAAPTTQVASRGDH